METDRNFTHSFAVQSKEDLEMEMIRKGPWTSEEDQKLTNFISVHGEGRWDSLARFAGLKRTGKSCRFRWLNYLRPNVIRGNITTQELILIFELHSRYGNRWSRIAQHLPGRTDNEIKNYWRTKVQKLAKQLKCDVNSYEFKYIVHYVWLPRLMEQVQASSDHSLTAYSSNCQRDSVFSTLSHPSNVYQNVMTERDVVLQTGINIVPIDTNRRSNVSHATIETNFDSDISPSSVPYDYNGDDDTILNNWCNNIFEDHELIISGANQLRDTHSTPFYLDDNMGGLIWG